jgi:hypothetical protein
MTTIHVVLIDAASGAAMGEADLPVDQLPESFGMSTTIHLGGSDWQVEHAEPVERADFVATGRVQLTLRKIVYADPSEILFSLPTLEDQAPPTGASSRDAVQLHEDDWRQRELIAARFEPEVLAELSEIRTIYAEHRRGPGFASLHVRKRIPEPLAGVSLAIGELEDLGTRGARRSIAIGPASQAEGSVVVGGFAFPFGGGMVYGREEAGAVIALCLDGDADDPSALAALAHTHDLVLVGWCSAELLRSDGTRFR